MRKRTVCGLLLSAVLLIGWPLSASGIVPSGEIPSNRADTRLTWSWASPSASGGAQSSLLLASSAVGHQQVASSTAAGTGGATVEGLSTTIKILALAVLVLAIVVFCMLLDRVLKGGEHKEHPDYDSPPEDLQELD